MRKTERPLTSSASGGAGWLHFDASPPPTCLQGAFLRPYVFFGNLFWVFSKRHPKIPATSHIAIRMEHITAQNRKKRFRGMLVSARKNAGLTQAELAKKLNRPQSYVSKYENGERRLDVVEFLEVTEALNIDSCNFLKLLRRAAPAGGGWRG